jgi:hypothetical protein
MTMEGPMTRLSMLVAGGLLLAAQGVSAQAPAPGEAVTVVDPIDIPPEHDPLAHAWDLPDQRGGFYLRGSTSLGGQSTRIGPANWQSDFDGWTTGGFSTGYNLDVGGFLRPWLALHADAMLGVLWSGSIDDLSLANQTTDHARVLSYGIAPAVTFFTPHDFFFKPAFGVGWATVKQGGRSDTSNPGFYMHLVAGKDLYVDRNFSFGLQFEVAYMLLNGDTDAEDVRVRQFQFGVSFAYDSI